MSKVLLDTNILIYALDKSCTAHVQCLSLLQDPQLEFYITTKNISEYFAVCSKLNFDFSSVEIFYRSICQNTTILFPDSNSLSVFESLMAKYRPRGNRVFDFEIIAVALANQIFEIATMNVADFSNVSEIRLKMV